MAWELPLLEREAPLARIRVALAAAAEGAGRLVVVEGAWGTGRTRLLEAVAGEARAAGARVTSLRGRLLDPREPAAPDPGAARPLVVVADDAQWLTGDGLRELAHGAGVLVVAAVRRGEPAVDPPALAALAEEADETVVLTALGEAAVVRALSERLGDARAATAWRAAAGNPGLVAALADTGDLAPAAAALAPVLDRRLARMGNGAEAVVHALAALGDGSDLAAVASVAQLEVDAAARAADALIRADVLAAGTELAFAQPLTRMAAEALPGPHARAMAHARAVRLLLDRGAGAERIAAHALGAPPAGDRRVVQALAEAADAAVARGAPADAVALLARALAEPPVPADRPAVLARLGTARLAEDEPTALATLEAAVAAADEPHAQAAAARELAVALAWHGRPDDALAVLERTRERLAAVDADAALMLDVVLFCTHFPLVSRTDAVAEVAERMRRQVERRGETLAAAAARLALAVSGACHGASAATVEAPVIEAVAHPALRTALGPELFGYAPVALWLTGRLDGAERLATGLVDDALQAGSRFGARSAHTARAAIRICAGDVRGAAADVDAARAGDESPAATFARIGIAGMAAELLVEQDRPLDAQRVLDEVVVAEDEDVGISLMLWHRAGAAVARALGDRSAERAALRAAGAVAGAWGLVNPTILPWRSRLALVVDDAEEAAELLDSELDIARAIGDRGAVGVALHAAALAAGGRGRSVELLEAAVDQLATSGRALEHARALVDLGSTLRRAGHRRDARPYLATGADVAVRRGGAAIARRAQVELQACGARPRRLVLRGVDALTPSERRVAELAAAGRSNREIAQALFVTVKTVETHLAHAYRKLDVRRRHELAPLLGPRDDAEDQGSTPRRSVPGRP